MIGSGEVTGGGRREISHIRGRPSAGAGGKKHRPAPFEMTGWAWVAGSAGVAGMLTSQFAGSQIGLLGRRQGCDDKEKTTAGGAGVRTGGGACGGGARGGDGGDWAAGGVDGVEGGDGGGGYWGRGRKVHACGGGTRGGGGQSVCDGD